MTVNLGPHRLRWSELIVSVISLHCLEEERPIVLSTDEKHGVALRKELIVKRWDDFLEVRTTENSNIIQNVFV